MFSKINRHDVSRHWLPALAVIGMVWATPAAVDAHEVDDHSAFNTGAFSFAAGLDITTHYFFRGINQEDSELIAQPWAEVSVGVYEGDTTIDNGVLTLGIWNSMHSEQTAATPNGTGPDWWYESDLYIALNVDIGEKWGGSVIYTAYTSPNDAFGTIHEIALGLSFDDAQCWEDAGISAPGFGGLQPYILVAFESDGSAFGADEGIYLELGIEPTFTLCDSQDFPLTLHIPVTVGLSISDYYDSGTDQDTFGFLDIGLIVTMPLQDVPADHGTWEVHAGLDFMWLGENVDVVNTGDNFDVVASLGISMEY